MRCGTHLDQEVNTAEDLSDPVQERIGSYPQTPRNKCKSSGRVPKTSTKTIFTTESATEKQTSSQQHDGDKDASNKDTRKDKNNQQGQCTGGNDPDDSGSDSSRNRISSSTLSVKSILQPQNNNQRGQCTKSVEQE